MLPYFDGEALASVLDLESLVSTLGDAFRRPAKAPARTQLGLDRGKVILMPAWQEDGLFGIKISTVFPDNRVAGLPTVGGTYCLLRATDGVPLAVMDGRVLTLLRTAAASALASSHLARPDASVLTIVGAGALAPYLVRAHATVLPVRKVLCWNRHEQPAADLAASLRAEGFPAEHVADLDEAVAMSDIVSAATLSQTPLVRGARLRPGTHVDLVGAFTPAMRESDTDAVCLSRIFVDTFEGAHEEAGDLLQAAAQGPFRMTDVAGDLHALVSGRVPGRTDPDQITLFKSVGTAIEDLAAATLAFERLVQGV